MARAEVFTVGYQGRRSVEDLIDVLRGASVDRVIDVRALPFSRKKGFSKTALRERLAKEGIDYVHLRQLGNPFREQKHDLERCLSLYAQHLDQAPQSMDELEPALQGRRAALLCFEADAAECHRSIIADRLASSGRKITHL